MQKALIVLAALAAVNAISMNAASQLKLKGGAASESVRAVHGAVAYAVDQNGHESMNTRDAMTSSAKEWLKKMENSRAKISSLKREQFAGKRAFDRKQAVRKDRYANLGMRDLFQEKVDKFAKQREEVAKHDASVAAKVTASVWGDYFRPDVEVPHLMYSNHLKLMKDDQGEVTVRTEIPVTEKAKQMGLMYQKSMPEDAGMLFVHNRPKQQVLYMRNTGIPLEVGWFDQDGVLQEIVKMTPHDERYMWTKGDMLVGLEANQGFWEKNGLETGKTRIDMEEVCGMLSLKGENNYELCPSHLAQK